MDSSYNCARIGSRSVSFFGSVPRWIGRERFSYHEEGPDGVVEEDDGGGHQHGETDELVELVEKLAFCFFFWLHAVTDCLRWEWWRHPEKQQQRNRRKQDRHTIVRKAWCNKPEKRAD